MHEDERTSRLVGAVVAADTLKNVVLEDSGSSRLREEAIPHVLRCIADKVDAGGVTLKSARTMENVKRSIGSALQPIIARYDMCVLLNEGGDAPETLTEDLISTAYRASAISVIFTACKVLDSEVHSDLLEKLDKTLFELERRSKDVQQFAFLKKPENAAVIAEAARESIRALRTASKDYENEGVQFAEPHLFERICCVLLDSARRVGIHGA
jgi:hypothetical protein